MIAQWRLNELGAEVDALREENAQLNDLATAAQTEQAEARSALLIMLFN